MQASPHTYAVSQTVSGATTLPTVHIVAERLSPRLSYVCEVVFGSILKCPYELFEWKGYVHNDNPVLYYVNKQQWSVDQPKPGWGVVWMQPHQLLFQSGVKPVDTDELDDLSAVFWLVMHYAAYDPSHPRDKHGRPARALLNDAQDPDFPYCHWVAAMLAAGLGIDHLISKEIRISHTFDIDNAYAYAAKGPWRWLGGLGKELIRGDFTGLKLRLRHALGRADDPYDTHAAIIQKWGGAGLRAFFLMSDKGTYDRSIPTSHPDFKRLVRQYENAGCRIGLHPSYDGGQNPNSLNTEKATLLSKRNESRSLTDVRYHYLRELTPHSQRLLIEAGFTDDYSPGPVKPGFWQGISVSIPWYDVERDEQTALTLHPACWMDATWAADAKAGLEHLSKLKSSLSAYGGEMVLIWHNDYFNAFRKALTQFPGLLDDSSIN